MSCVDLSVATETTSPSAPELYPLHLTPGVLHIWEAGFAGWLSSLQPICGRAPNRAPLASCSSYIFAQKTGRFLFLRNTNLAYCLVTEEETEGQRGKPARPHTEAMWHRVSGLLAPAADPVPSSRLPCFLSSPFWCPIISWLQASPNAPSVTVAGWKWTCRAAQSATWCLSPSTAPLLAE